MSRGRLALLVLGVGALGSQAGHLLAYELRFGAAAAHLQSSGAHSYFPAVAKTGLGLAAFGLLAGLLIVGAARVIASKPVAGAPAPHLVRLLAVMYTLQIAVFAVQETAEALLGGAPAGSAPLLLMWGAVGQLPVAIAAALAVRWLLVQVRPALETLRLSPHVPTLLIVPVAVHAWPLTVSPATVEVSAGTCVRGPPSS